MGETKYCPCCGEYVEFTRVERADRVEFSCIACFFPLADYTDPSGKDIPGTQHEKHTFRMVLVADDSKFTRIIIHDVLVDKNLAENVQTFQNGLELISAFTRLVEEKVQPDAIILDINMPVMDGFTAAMEIRKIEKQHNISPAPIIFFSSTKADDHLKAQMEKMAPANYVNKSTDPDPDRLAERIEQIFANIAKLRQ